MRIILSPANKMRQDTDSMACSGIPLLLEKTEKILDYLKGLSFEELQALWGCNYKIVMQNKERLNRMDLKKQLTPAVLSYEGIAFRYMAPSVFENRHFEYAEGHLRILSGFYGVLMPLDGVRPYRLEMQAKAAVSDCKNLYEFWGRDIYDTVRDDDGIILNLASKEYSRCIENYLTPTDTFITCVFCENVRGKLRQKGTFAKMARGEMVRYLAENQIEDPEYMKEFNRLDYHFRGDLSSEENYVFERIPQNR